MDVENLLGSTYLTEAVVSDLCARYGIAARVACGDSVVIASSHACARAVWFGWEPCVRRCVRSGPDGADLALLQVIQTEGLGGRFGQVVIGSGDGIFAETASRLHAAGVLVTVISRPESLSRRLSFAVTDVRYLVPSRGNGDFLPLEAGGGAIAA